jgi:hypothetical protein
MIAAILVASMMFAEAAPSAAPPASKTPTSVSGVTVTGEASKKRAPPDPKEVVCHKEPVMGSLFPKTICAQRQEVAQRTREDQKDIRDMLQYNPLKSN